jgi:hypothetical protein
MGEMKKSLRAVLIPFVVAAALIAGQAAGQGAGAKDEKELAEAGQKIDKAGTPADPSQVSEKVLAPLSTTKFTCDATITCTGGTTSRVLTTQDIEKLRTKGLGFGEISILLALTANQTTTTPKTLNHILLMRQSGEGWGKLARDLGHRNLGSVIRNVKATERGLDRMARERREKPDKAGKLESEELEKPGKPERLDKPERLEKVQRVERPERVEKVERVERVERPERHGR